jgi:glycerol-3-phosphate cytidylyltransferase-like family protein
VSSRTVITFGTFDVLHVATSGCCSARPRWATGSWWASRRRLHRRAPGDVLVMGDDRAGRFDWVSDVCEVVYLPRTPSVSTTGLIEHIATSAPTA